MIIAIDIGNTNISCAVMEGLRVKRVASVLHSKHEKRDAKRLQQILRSFRARFKSITAVVICSVVPRKNTFVKKNLRKILSCPVFMVGRNIAVNIKNKYRRPGQVGKDRLVGAYAVKILFGAPAIVIDLGTAITFDVINGKGEYEGGMIVPGIKMSAESLFKKTALLPQLKRITTPRSLVGKTTQESILSGLFYGYGAMGTGLIEMIGRQIKGKLKVIVTGGYASYMKPFIKKKDAIIEPHLVFKGLSLIYTSTKLKFS